MNTPLTVTDRGSVMLASRLRLPGERIERAEFKGYEALMADLLKSGVLSEQPVETTGIDSVRTKEVAPPIPHEIDLGNGKKGPSLQSVPGGNEGKTMKLVQDIKEAQAARQKALSDVGPDAVVTPDEAKALGLVK